MIALYPIKPVYTDRILSGEKTYELRRRLPKEPLTHVLIYSTHPVGKVVGYAKVQGIVKGPAQQLWDMLQNKFGICKEDYFSYFDGCDEAKAIQFSEVRKFNRPFKLSEISEDLSVPQSFCYLDKDIFSKIRRRKNTRVL